MPFVTLLITSYLFDDITMTTTTTFNTTTDLNNRKWWMDRDKIHGMCVYVYINMKKWNNHSCLWYISVDRRLKKVLLLKDVIRTYLIIYLYSYLYTNIYRNDLHQDYEHSSTWLTFNFSFLIIYQCFYFFYFYNTHILM